MFLGRTPGPKAQTVHRYLRNRNPVLNLAVPSSLALLPTPAEPPERHPFKNAAPRQV